MKLKSKLFASAVAFTMVLGLVAVPVSAQTTAELQAQIASLLALINQLNAQISGGASAGAGTTFTTDLTVGSKGAEVSALQQWLVGKGFLTMPAGVAFGNFGPLTKAALAAYQTSAGITPAVGYFGPITRARVNALAVVPGTTPGTTVPVGSITTPGAEGTIAATESSAGTVSTVYEGDTMSPVLGIKITAASSDMAVQRMKFKVSESSGNYNTQFYNKVYDKLSVTEGGNVLASIDLNSSTVIKDGTSYYVTVAGFNSIIPKGSFKTYLIKLDAFSSIDSTVLGRTFTLAVATDGIRAVDGAGIDQYSGTTGISAAPDITTTLSDAATLSLSLNTSSPKTQDVVCSGGVDEDECDKLTVLVFDAKAEKDAVTITDLQLGVAKAGTGAAVASSTLYIYDGSTEIDSTSVTGVNTYIFTDFDQTIAKDTTKTYTVKIDVRDANITQASFVATASSTGITDENSKGDSVADSGTATGYSIGVRDAGPEFTLVSKSVTTAGAPQIGGTSAPSTSTLTALFNVKVKAVGADILLGTVASGTPMFASSTTSFKVYRNGAYDSAVGHTGGSSSVATTTSFLVSSTCVADSTNSCTLPDGAEATVAVTYQIYGRSGGVPGAQTSGLYSIGLEGIQWNAVGYAGSSIFMAGLTDWRTTDVSFP